MINKKKVFILGAGASSPYGFPTAMELRKEIIDEAPEILTELLGFLIDGKDDQEYKINFSIGCEISRKLKLASVNSIDRFLNEQVEYIIENGKILILAIIRECEKRMKFAEDIYNPDLDWYKFFFNHLISGVKKFEDLSFKGYTIITFNYDRSFEWFLYLAIRNLYPQSKVSDKSIVDLLKTLDIHHVFGKVDKVVWELDGIISEREFWKYFLKKQYRYDDLLKNINNIKLFNDVMVENRNYKETIETANDVFFLGFGFLEENMEILGAPFQKNKLFETKYYATALGVSEENIKRYYSKYLSQACKINYIKNCDCCTLLKDYLIN